MIEIHAVTGIGEIEKNTDLAQLLSIALTPISLKTGDILVVTQKIVSKAEGRMIALSSVSPGPRAIEIGNTIGKDPRLVELILSESTDIVRAQKGVIITRHRIGLVMANAGIDCSNLGPGQSDSALLLPLDPDASAAVIADKIENTIGIRPAVIISDSFGRPWRHGVVNVAIGCAGLPSLYDKRGEPDRNGRVMQATLIAYGDLIAAAAGLAMGEADEGVPAAVVRGLTLPESSCPASALIRSRDEDMFL
jgi:coenzyme F420-0:L-glutamate ligase / coenzyme F420-1:gamma-L-glutamate ligase